VCGVFSRISLKLEELLPQGEEKAIGKRTAESAVKTPKNSAKRKSTKKIISISAVSPSCSSCSIPILSVLAREPNKGMRAKNVIREVKGWFSDLGVSDVEARYPKSKKRITETVIKFCKKNLTLKNKIYRAGIEVGCVPLGLWKITPEGMKNLEKEKAAWKPKYSIHKDAILITFNDGNDGFV
jgi:hypothetical protein